MRPPHYLASLRPAAGKGGHSALLLPRTQEAEAVWRPLLAVVMTNILQISLDNVASSKWGEAEVQAPHMVFVSGSGCGAESGQQSSIPTWCLGMLWKGEHLGSIHLCEPKWRKHHSSSVVGWRGEAVFSCPALLFFWSWAKSSTYLLKLTFSFLCWRLDGIIVAQASSTSLLQALFLLSRRSRFHLLNLPHFHI